MYYLLKIIYQSPQESRKVEQESWKIKF